MLTSGGDAFYDLALDKTTNNLTLTDDMNIANTLDFQAADNYIVLDNNNLQVLHITGYDATRHVRSTGTGFGAYRRRQPGRVSCRQYFLQPATLSNAGASDLYFVRVADAVLSDGDAGAPLTADAVHRTWFIEEGTPGGSDLTLGVQWNGSEELTGFDHGILVLITLAAVGMPSPSFAAGADPYTLTRTGIATLSPFAVFGGGFVPVIDISGIILWEHDGVSGVQNASVALTGDAVDNTITPSTALLPDGEQRLQLYRYTHQEYQQTERVTVADALAIQQHVAGNVPITSPYKQVAADVNKSNSITGFDATIINQSLLGNPSALNQFKTSWRFVPISYAMSVPPWGFPEKINLAGVSGNTPDQDFWGIKTGDVVDIYADPANMVQPLPLVLRAGNRVLQAGEEIAVDFRAGQFEDLAAWQFALPYDPAQMQLTGIETLGGLPLIPEDHFSTFQPDAGELRAAWSQAEGYRWMKRRRYSSISTALQRTEAC
ncbi:MAG: dockerin type I domain-containing protein [Saprospiraceae bacterium]